MSWTTVAAPTGFYSWTVDPDTFYVFRADPTGTEKWAVEADTFYVFRGNPVGTDDWSINSEPLDAFYEGWRSWINPNASLIKTFLGVSEAVEDLDINPEDMDLEPEFIQQDATIDNRFYDDTSGWTVVSGFGRDD